MNKKLLLFLIPLLFFIPKDTFALNNSFTNFKYVGNDLNIAKFYTVGAGNNIVVVNGKIDTSTTSSFSTYMYINLNVCTDMNLNSINTPNGIDNMYVYQPGQSCQFNGSAYKGKVFNIYFRAQKTFNTDFFYSGSFYLSSSNEHSIELINYYANVEGFPMNNNESYVKDLQELKDILQNSNSTIKDSIDKNTDSVNKQTEETKKTNDYLTDDGDATFDSSKLDTVTGLFPEGPVDSLLTIPFKFLSVIVSSLSGSCVPFTCNFVYDTTFTFPCFDSILWNSSNVDSNLLNYLSLIPSAFILIIYFKYLYKKVERATSMETTTDDEWGCV